MLFDLSLTDYQSSLLLQQDAQGATSVFDPIRRKWIKLLPEEWVRQLLICHLTQGCGFPLSRLRVEQAIPFGGFTRRADLVAYSREGKPWLLAECKSFSVPLTLATIEQTAHYFSALATPYLLLTNGRDAYCCEVNAEAGTVTALAQLPALL